MKIKSLSGQTIYEDDSDSFDETVKNALSQSFALEDTNIARVGLHGAYLNGISFKGSIATDATLSHGKFNDGVFTYADFSRARFERAELKRALAVKSNFAFANLDNVKAEDINLSRSCLAFARFSGADLIRAILKRASMPNVSADGAKFNYADLSNACLSQGSFRESDFSGADLSNANFSGADLRRAKFHGANISNACFSDAKLRGTDGLDHFAITPLEILREQPGPYRMFFVVSKSNKSGERTEQEEIRVGETYTAKNEDTFEVCTRSRFLRSGKDVEKVFSVEIEDSDLVIPMGSSELAEAKRIKVVGGIDFQPASSETR